MEEEGDVLALPCHLDVVGGQRRDAPTSPLHNILANSSNRKDPRGLPWKANHSRTDEPRSSCGNNAAFHQ